MLSYQIDIWATESSVAMELFCELLFRLLDSPAISVQHQGMEEPLVKYLDILEVMDNTDTSQISTRGRLSRFTIVTQLNAHIAKLIENDRIFIVPEFYSYDGKSLK